MTKLSGEVKNLPADRKSRREGRDWVARGSQRPRDVGSRSKRGGMRCENLTAEAIDRKVL